MLKNRKLIVPILVVVLALVSIKVISYAGSGKNGAAQETGAPVRTIQTQAVATVSKTENLSLTGNIEANNDAVISAKIGGKVSQILIENGAAVRAGQALVLLETDELHNNVVNCQAVFEKAQAGLASARSNYERIKALYEGGAISKQSLDDVTTALQVAENDERSAAAGLANAREALSNATVTAPLNGFVHDRQVTLGQVVGAGQQLMSVGDLSSVYVTANIAQEDLAKIKKGLPADIFVNAYPDKKFAGIVEIINPAMDQAARVFQTKIKVNNGENLLMPGMFAKAEIKIGQAQDVPAVPMNAVTSSQGMYFVFVVEGDRVKRRQVEIGQMVGQSVEVKSGLALGERVAVSNVNMLRDQDLISVTQQ